MTYVGYTVKSSRKKEKHFEEQEGMRSKTRQMLRAALPGCLSPGSTRGPPLRGIFPAVTMSGSSWDKWMLVHLDESNMGNSR